MIGGRLPERARERIALARIASIALLGLLLACGRDPRPNVVLVSIDTLRADHLHAYGYERETAPSLTRLAAEGARFATSYSQSSSTVPTHASLFTGRYPFQHGSYHVGLPVSQAENTLAERFAAAGYRTFAATSSVRFRGNTGFDQGFQTFLRFDELDKNARSQAVTDAFLAWAGETREPWFAFLHYFDPHQPYAPPEPFRSRWHAAMPGLRPEGTSDYLYFHDGPDKPVPPNVLDWLRALYDGEIRFLDVQLARLFAGVAVRPGTPGTIVVVTADHGEEFKEHGGLSHSRRLHEELLRVPLFVWWPGHVPAGRVIQDPVQTVDVLPTLLELAGLPAAQGLPGRSHARELLGTPADDVVPPGGDVVLAQIRAARWALTADVAGSRFKYIYRDDAPHRLFDLQSDPGERVDLSAERPEAVGALQELASEIGVGTVPPGQRPAAKVDPEIRKRLREIGYVDEADESEAGSGGSGSAGGPD